MAVFYYKADEGFSAALPHQVVLVIMLLYIL
jgi:hypothetical protein